MGEKIGADVIVAFTKWMVNGNVVQIDLPVDQAQAMKALRTMLESLLVRSEGNQRREGQLRPALVAVETLLRSARVHSDRLRVAFDISSEQLEAVRASVPYLEEYQILAEHDAIRASRKRSPR